MLTAQERDAPRAIRARGNTLLRPPTLRGSRTSKTPTLLLLLLRLRRRGGFGLGGAGLRGSGIRRDLEAEPSGRGKKIISGTNRPRTRRTRGTGGGSKEESSGRRTGYRNPEGEPPPWGAAREQSSWAGLPPPCRAELLSSSPRLWCASPLLCGGSEGAGSFVRVRNPEGFFCKTPPPP